MREIDGDRLLEERRIHTYYHLPNGDIAIPLIDIKNAPTIEPQRKKGMWINHRCDDGHHIADCDQCEHSLQWFDDDIPKYCCECGADMREPEDIPMEYFESGGR